VSHTPVQSQIQLAELAESLRQRLGIIADEQSRRDPEQHIARLRAVSERIDRLCAGLPPTVDNRLKHYLERRSYDKALDWLEGNA
jgi:hypothetical protein